MIISKKRLCGSGELGVRPGPARTRDRRFLVRILVAGGSI